MGMRALIETRNPCFKKGGVMARGLYVVQAGTQGPALVLLHGQAGNGEVWRPLIDAIGADWPGRILAPDLRGHGRSPPARHYGFASQAADVADLFERGERVVVLGHSMGAGVGLALATGWYGVHVAGLVGVGLKVAWRDEELSKAAGLARTPTRWFERREDAVARFLKVSGLEGLLPEDHPAVAAGVAEDGSPGPAGRFRLAADIATSLAAGPDVKAMRRAAACPTWFASGSEDAMVPAADLRELDPDGFVFGGLGHNPHVQDPAALWAYAGPRLKPLLAG